MNILELAILKKMVGGGGGSGTDNYNDLSNLPQINGETLAGNKTAENLGLQDALTFDSAPTEDSTNPVESGGVYNALAGKQDNLTFDGVYNASTNKAATESTVTNAIAGLDVSAFSVDADETISSISETDGKVSVTKQDIAIASNQVVAMTGYTKPSSAPATPAIQQGDTANAAIGKLEYKADVNQSNILLLQHQQNIFAYHVNPNESDPYEAVTYLENAKGMIPAKMTGGGFSYGSWGSAFFLPKPCVLKFDGTVDYYLNPYDYSKKIDGSAATIDSSNTTGNVMLEFPKIWVKRVPGATAGERTVYIADSKVDNDYKCFSNINSSNEEKDHFYIHAYNGTIHSSQMRSLSGVTLNSTYAPNYTARQEILAAKANNPSGSAVMWFTDVWSDMQLLFDLLYLMGKSLDVQRTFGQGLSASGETAMRAYVTGTHNDKGLFYGDTIGTSTAVKVLGIENLWACRWNRIAGLINVAGNLKVKMTYGTADGSTATEYETPLDSTDATANLTGAGYLDYGTILKSNGYVSQIQADNSKGYKITSVSSGANNKYYCDYYYQASTANTKYYALLGGSSGTGANCGFCVDLCDGAVLTSWSFGGALSCKP